MSCRACCETNLFVPDDFNPILTFAPDDKYRFVFTCPVGVDCLNVPFPGFVPPFIASKLSPSCQELDCGSGGLCFDKSTCACDQYGNDAVSGSMACPNDGTKSVSGTVAKCSYKSKNAADYPDTLNRIASTALINLLFQALIPLCTCAPIKFDAIGTIINQGTCNVTYNVFAPNGTFADPTHHDFTVSAGTSGNFPRTICGLTGTRLIGPYYFDLGGGLKAWFTSPYLTQLDPC